MGAPLYTDRVQVSNPRRHTRSALTTATPETMHKHGGSLTQVLPVSPSLPTGGGPTATPTLERPATPFGVFLGRIGYAFAWICIHLFQVVCALYFIAAGYIYWKLPVINTGWVLQLYSLTIDTSYFHAIAILHFVIAALHLRFLITPIGYKIMANFRSLRQQRKLSTHERPLTLHDKHPHPQVLPVAPRSQRWRFLSAIQFVYGVLFAPSGLFGVESQSFETIFLCREVVETSMQAYQAYTMSRLLPRESLVRFYVAMLILNCWTTPVLHRVTRDKALQRLWCLISDILLDFISAVGVPVILAINYLHEYDSSLADFPWGLWYNDQWLIRFMGDAPLILCGSWMAALNRLAFSLGMLVSIDDVQVLIKRRFLVLVPGKPTKAAIPARPSRIVQWIHRVMVLFGLLILAAQLHAESKPAPASCVVKVRPWFVQKPACALVEVNCLLTPAFSTDPALVALALAGLDELSVEYLVIKHCPSIEMPSKLQHLANLIGLKTYNSTFAKWEADSALTQSHHPNVRFLFLVRTNFSNGELPDGLISTHFPQMLSDIEISITNLQSLPEDLDSRWPQYAVLVIEFAQFTAFPRVLYRLQPRSLSLCGNQITTLPPEAFLIPTTRKVSFTGNPITTLPDAGVDPREVLTLIFYLDMTRIASLPQWMDEPFFQAKSVSLGGTRICVDVLLNDSAIAEREELLAARPSAMNTIDCVVLAAEDQPFFPYYLEE